MRIISQWGLLVFLACNNNIGPQQSSLVDAFSVQPGRSVPSRAVPQQQQEQQQPCEQSRRSILQNIAAVTAGGVAAATIPVALMVATPSPAIASGGATAGKYTTIPIAKRRYYGRVQASVHEFLALGPTIIEADFSAPRIQNFFDPNALVVVEAKRKDINGQCTKKDGNCKGLEVRDSYYNDMKTSMYLLGNAFRLNQTKAPDNLPSVRAAKAFFKEMDLVEKAAKKGRKDDKDAIRHYAAALDALDAYLDLVELPPTDSGWYEQEFSRATGDSARIT